MLVLLAVALVAIASISIVKSECANACNGHGRCTSYDMCICNRNWQAADCSERVCLFGLAHVDTPKGDLNGNGVVDSPDKLLIENSYVWPYGTTEQFPAMEDSDLNPISNSAHYYTECSNKGKCDRSTGDCVCYDGYDGVACQRASCPGYPASCSGHGVCKTISQLAASASGNVYSLWDQDKTMGCECDAGYYGPDCSLRQCKVGVDPLYLDDISTVKYSVFDFATIVVDIKTTPTVMSKLFNDGTPEKGTGYFVIRFFDSFGEDWVTEPLPGGASCDEILTALYNLPNDVIPMSTLLCSSSTIINSKQQSAFEESTGKWYESDHDEDSTHPVRIVQRLAFWEAYQGANEGELSFSNSILDLPGSNSTLPNGARRISGFFYRIKFFGNPGAIKVPEISVYLDGKRPSLVSGYGKVVTKVWTDGQQGEYNDYFADHCDGVTATIGTKALSASSLTATIPKGTGTGKVVSYLTGMTMTEKNLLKACLGNSDFTSDNNIDVYNWDLGSKFYPHIIKLVRTVTTYTDGGYYAVIWYDTRVLWDMTGSEGTFRILNTFMPPDNFLTDKYDIYTTQGTLALTSDKSEATFGFASKYVYMINTTYDTAGYNVTNDAINNFDGDISCVTGNNDAYRFDKDANGKPLYIQHCLNTSDVFTLLNWDEPWLNPKYINLYSAERLYTEDYSHSVGDHFSGSEIRKQVHLGGNVMSPVGNSRPFNPVEGYEMHYMTHMITTDIPTNWAVTKDPAPYWRAAGPSNGRAPYYIYKFFPAAASTYNYVAPCSNRGICDTDSGLCSCFPGYTADDCSEQAALHV